MSDGRQTIIGAVMEHIEEAGIHSGDSACALPPHSLPREIVDTITREVKALAAELVVEDSHRREVDDGSTAPVGIFA